MTSNVSSVRELVDRLEHAEKFKEDYLVPAAQISMTPDGEHVIFPSEQQHPFRVQNYAHHQLAQQTSIPWKYYQEMSGDETLARLRAINVNTMLERQEKKLFVRTIATGARAFLSDGFRPIDNIEMIRALAPAVAQAEDLQVGGVTLSESRLYIQLLSERFKADVRPGDPVQFGIILRNSEVGNGAWALEEYIYRLVCANGAVGRSMMRKVHLGNRLTNGEGSVRWNRDTVEAEMKSIQLATRDVIADFLNDEAGFQRRINGLREAADQPVTKVIETVEKVTQRLNLAKGDTEHLINLMGESKDFTRYGLGNAITAHARSKESQEVQYEYEKAGFQLFDMSKAEWERLAN